MSLPSNYRQVAMMGPTPTPGPTRKLSQVFSFLGVCMITFHFVQCCTGVNCSFFLSFLGFLGEICLFIIFGFVSSLLPSPHFYLRCTVPQFFSCLGPFFLTLVWLGFSLSCHQLVSIPVPFHSIFFYNYFCRSGFVFFPVFIFCALK